MTPITITTATGGMDGAIAATNLGRPLIINLPGLSNEVGFFV